MASVIIETSARHVHVTEEDLHTLFGEGYELTVRKELSQPGEFASGERVTIVGPKRSLENVSILGPCRKQTQVELSFTDARALGLTPPIRLSGDLAGSPGCTITGPCGTVTIDEGVIVSKRHLHCCPEDAEKYGITDHETVLVKVGGERGLIFDEVEARVGPTHATFIHVDYDEINAAALFSDTVGTVLKK